MHPLEEKFYAIGSTADGFTPFLSMIGGALGWWRHFSVPRDVYADVEMMLQQKRIPMRNWQRIDDVCAFDIDAGSAPLVALLLRQQFGIEFTRPPRWLTHDRRPAGDAGRAFFVLCVERYVKGSVSL